MAGTFSDPSITNETRSVVDPLRTDSDISSRRWLRKVIFNPFLCSLAAAIGIFGGISSLAAGVLCVVIHSALPTDQIFDRVGTTLLIVGIPMLFVGSVFLDEIEPKQ